MGNSVLLVITQAKLLQFSSSSITFQSAQKYWQVISQFIGKELEQIMQKKK